ncbi:peptide chain release factor 2 [Nitrospina watsonii]|uniref:peptide chain release factor 2 n=1 Tax=Nitrospina watsonii TaxID=1323948 RepID=UPI002491F7FB|nr:peptide chain release factor 2 [Nitrospina watsonii]
MIDELKKQHREQVKRIERIRGFFDVDAKVKEIEDLDQKTTASNFWNDNEAAQKTLQRRSSLQRSVKVYQDLIQQSDDLEAMLSLMEEEGDASMESEGETLVKDLETALSEAELKAMLSAENDGNNAILNINSGAGGTESQDWAQMLLRMYLRWADRNGYKTEVLDMQYGEEAGIKSATVNVVGDYAYGYLKAEIGVHRLVRISPYDANKRRHTSFASVFVFPEVAEDIDVEVKDDDLKIDVYRASGPGGQGVNTTDSAVRITHMPTGIVVQCQNERSQHKNKASAMKVLKSRLYEMEIEKQEEEKRNLEKDKKRIEWGSQIRSYVLHPYQLAKDLRTQVEMGDVASVLDGDLNRFIEAYLMKENVSA